MTRSRTRQSLARFAERALRLAKDSAAVYDGLLPSEAKYADALQLIHDRSLEVYYLALRGMEE